MGTKICKTCQVEKPLEEFSFSNKEKTKYRPHCKICYSQYQHGQYLKDPEKYIRRATIRNNEIRPRNIKYVFDYLQEHPCIDCGEKHPIKLEFDHRDGKEKKAGIAELLQGTPPISEIQEEIDKCDVRCSNCHKVKTAIERNWTMYQLYTEYIKNNPNKST
jgi:hypothetical protein